MGRTLVSSRRTPGRARARIAVLITALLPPLHLALADEHVSVISGCLPLTLADGDRFNAPPFEKFAVNEAFTGKPARPIVRARQARRFRTQVREGASAGPNFAGHYTVVAWGCGSSCVSFAIVDAKSGRVFFPPGIDALAMDHIGLGPKEPEPPVIGLRYRIDSRLLVVLGAPNEDLAQEGIAYYEWTGSALKRLLFLRNQKTDCPEAGPASATPPQP